MLLYITMLTMYFFVLKMCVFVSSPTGVPRLEVCLMWPDAEKELLFRFQSLPKPHRGAMSHAELLAVIDLRSGTL